MGWWPFSSSSSVSEPPSSASSAPSEQPGSGSRRSQREKCWAAKDAYFACLDDASVLVPGDEGAGKDAPCAQLRVMYEATCQKSWVNYFNTRRVLAEEQKEILAMQQAQQNARRR